MGDKWAHCAPMGHLSSATAVVSRSNAGLTHLWLLHCSLVWSLKRNAPTLFLNLDFQIKRGSWFFNNRSLFTPFSLLIIISINVSTLININISLLINIIYSVVLDSFSCTQTWYIHLYVNLIFPSQKNEGKEMIHFWLRPGLLKNQYRGNSIQISREDFYPRHSKEVVPAGNISGARNLN